HISRRIHLIRVRGALRLAADDAALGYYNLRNPLHVSADDTAAALLAAGIASSSSGAHVSITSPMNLLKEIFTVKGAGTVIREGSKILRSHGTENVDRPRMLTLLQESFGRPLKDPAFLDRVVFFHMDADYRGAVLLEEHPAGLYLSKFAVGTDARGSGIAQELWEDVISSHPSVFWRSRAGNPIGRWYSRICDGMQKAGHWNVYWRGIQEERIPSVIAYCRSKAEDFSGEVSS
ncbi:MAG: hypothetical protein HY042_09305, partial [Spirochaetia bacterium]|nr:hypothetical protein [Spirochaetia bacterium]